MSEIFEIFMVVSFGASWPFNVIKSYRVRMNAQKGRNMRTYMDIAYVDNASEMQLLDIYLPDQDGFDTVIWFHGGGIEKGSRKEIHFEESFVVTSLWHS